MRISAPRLAALALVLLAGCKPRVTSQTYAYAGKGYQAVFDAVVAEMCAEKRIIVIKADSEEGEVHAVIRGKGHPEIRVLVAQKVDGASVTIPFPPGNPSIDEFFLKVSRRLTGPAAATPAGAPAATAVPAPVATSATPAAVQPAAKK